MSTASARPAGQPVDPSKARKQGVSASTRTARKAGPRQDNGSDSDEENVVKSSSSGSVSAGRAGTATSDTKSSKSDDADNVQEALVKEAGVPFRNTKPTAVGRGKNIPPNSGKSSKSVTAGKQSLKAIKAGAKRRYTESPDAGESDEDSSPKVSSRSRSGHSSCYQWDVDMPTIRPQDIGTRLTYHNSINTTLEREGKFEKVRFRRGDKLWILPDPDWLPEVSHDVQIVDLPDDEFWVAEILDCCSLDQSDTGGDNLGLLRVAWYYNGDHALELKNLHEDYKKKIRKYRFDADERIRSDHMDFIGIECFAGFADGIETFLNLSGLEVDDKDRLKVPALREKNKKFVMMAGWKIKASIAAQQARLEAAAQRKEATKSKKLRKSGRNAESDDE